MNFTPYHYLFKGITLFLDFTLKSLRFYKQGYQNSLDIQINQKELDLIRLPESFHEIRILFLSDLHLGNNKTLTDIIIEKIKNIKIDLCLFGGDYKYCSFTHPTLPYLEDLERIISNIQAPLGIYGVLGNHDDITNVPDFESFGLRLLLNDAVAIEKNGEKIYLVGVDESRFHRRHNIKKAFYHVPKDAFTLCLTHAPDIYSEVETHQPDFYLCGHTHHGQIRLPWIGSLITSSTAPKKFTEGFWKYKNMLGYTGSGVGSGNPSVRFLCPPEIVVLTLKSAKRGGE